MNIVPNQFLYEYFSSSSLVTVNSISIEYNKLDIHIGMFSNLMAASVPSGTIYKGSYVLQANGYTKDPSQFLFHIIQPSMITEAGVFTNNKMTLTVKYSNSLGSLVSLDMKLLLQE